MYECRHVRLVWRRIFARCSVLCRRLCLAALTHQSLRQSRAQPRVVAQCHGPRYSQIDVRDRRPSPSIVLNKRGGQHGRGPYQPAATPGAALSRGAISSNTTISYTTIRHTYGI